MAACTASGDCKISSSGVPASVPLVISSSKDGVAALAGDCGNSSAAWAVGVAADTAEEAPASAATAAEGTSEASAAVVDSGNAAVATSGTVDGSETGASGVRFQGVQLKLRDETDANADVAMALE